MKYNIDPTPKPRMTQSDKWKKRPPVQRYYAFKDHANLLGITIPTNNSHIIFTIQMPKSWSQKKKTAMNGTPHQQTPDKDNLEKALMDAIMTNDAVVYDSRVSKIWGETGSIEIIDISETSPFLKSYEKKLKPLFKRKTIEIKCKSCESEMFAFKMTSPGSFLMECGMCKKLLNMKNEAFVSILSLGDK